MRSFQTAGRSARLELARDQLLLELEAEDDVEAVGDLVGLDRISDGAPC